MGKRVRVLLVDDHPIVRQGIRRCLAPHAMLEVVGEAANGAEAIARAVELRPDVVIMDLTMPEMNGLEATRRLLAVAPRTKVVVMSVHDDKHRVIEMVRAGCKGYVVKDAPPAELVRAIESVQRGEIFFSTGVVNLLLGDSRPLSQQELSERELEVLALIADGRSNREIASLLLVSKRTVETHRKNIMKKLEIRSTAGLTRFAISHGIVPRR